MMIEDVARPEGRRYTNPYEHEAGQRPTGMIAVLVGLAAFVFAAITALLMYSPRGAFATLVLIALAGYAARFRVLHRMRTFRTV